MASLAFEAPVRQEEAPSPSPSPSTSSSSASASAVSTSTDKTPSSFKRTRERKKAKRRPAGHGPLGASASGSQEGEATPVSRVDSLKGALIRSLLGALAVFFRAPVRLYRPVKISALSVLDALAQREGTTLSLKFLRTVWKRERPAFFAHLLGPPLLINTLIGLTLFESFSLTERALLRRYTPFKEQQHDSAGRPILQWSPLWIVTVSGGVAGAAQCLISAPLDNVRKVLSRASTDPHHRRPFSWTAVMRAAILPFAPTETQHQRMMGKVKDSLSLPSKQPGNGDKGKNLVKHERWQRYLSAWRGGAHGSGLVLSLTRDSIGFASFFAVFEVSRRVAYHASIAIDAVYYTFNKSPTILPGFQGGGNVPRSAPSPGSHGDVHITDDELKNDYSFQASRSLLGRTIAALALIIGGALGAAAYELLGRPAELMRTVLFEGERKWHKAVQPSSAQRTAFRSRRTATEGQARRAPRRIRRAVRATSHTLPRAPGAQARSIDQRRATLASLRSAMTTGSSAPRIGGSTAPAVSSNAEQRKIRAVARKERYRRLFEHLAEQRKPSAYSMLRDHALRHWRHQHPRRNPPPTLPLLIQTYFLQPFGLSFQSAWKVRNGVVPGGTPENSLRHRWTIRNTVNQSIVGPEKLGQAGSYWGRATWWLLRRMATPYGAGLAAFAIFGGDLAS